MDKKNIIQQGERVKYMVTFLRPDFNPEEMDFELELRYGFLGRKIVIPKSGFLYGTGGEWLFSFPTDGIVGKVTARMILHMTDTDISSDDDRQEVDEQVIAFVVTTPCPQFLTCPACTGSHDVSYERTEESDIASMYMRLVSTEWVQPDAGGDPYPIYRPLLTRDDQYIYVLRITPESNNQ